MKTTNTETRNEHGPLTSRYKSGQLSSIETYENGDIKYCATYYINGQKETEF